VLPFVAPDLVWPDLRELLLLLGVGVGAQAGQIFITRGFAHETASRGTALAFLQVVFAAGFGVIVFGDTLGPSLLFGASLIAGGTLLAIRDGAATR